MGAVVLIAVIGIIIYIAIKINKSVRSATEDLPPFGKSFFRALSLTLTYGVGIIGGEGFALPGPLIGALVFYNGPKYYQWTAIAPAAFWFSIFFTFQYIRNRNN